ncbi:TetR/AcrR family transcriptional regulator [Nonomuraea sp. NPDC050663]|uniref:TetR/AcrR family transcriptional regulator n=1 Tax=Nonomuraea sp. NPDC050663 TaxID=3364370 RepID=UPI0037A02E5E
MPRDVSTSKDLGSLRRDLLDAAVRVLRDEGATHLTLRRVADAAGTSTMGIYTGFGGRAGLLEAVYEYGFRALHGSLTASLDGRADPIGRILAVAHGYREFALADPRLYALMFERPLAGFDPSPEVRRAALDRTFALLTEAIGAAAQAGLLRPADPVRAGYLVWTTIHGIVSIELTCGVRTRLPGWFLDSREEGERVLAEGVATLLTGLGATELGLGATELGLGPTELGGAP